MKIKTGITMTALALAIALPGTAADGPALYKKTCSTCHGADGAGQTPMGKKLKLRDLRSTEVRKQTDIELMKIIAGGKEKMPAYGQKMSTTEIQAVIAFIRTLK